MAQCDTANGCVVTGGKPFAPRQYAHAFDCMAECVYTAAMSGGSPPYSVEDGATFFAAPFNPAKSITALKAQQAVAMTAAPAYPICNPIADGWNGTWPVGVTGL